MNATATAGVTRRAVGAPDVSRLDWDEVGPAVELLLRDYVESAQVNAASVWARELWGHIGRGLDGGKRLRPQLVCLAYGAFGGTEAGECAAVGTSFELLHGALVVHDDVIDRDFVRRGHPNVAGIYREAGLARGLPAGEASHLGSSVAVIAGDLLLTASLRMLERTTAEPAIRSQLTEILHGAIADAAAGELADVLLARPVFGGDLAGEGDGRIDDVLDMERLKTATYSFEAPLRAGAVLAGADAGAIDAVGRVGSLVGTAYQVIDDVLGTFGDERQTGKPATSDLREGKLTVLTAFAHPESASPRSASPRSASPGSGPDLDQMRDALHEAGADSYALTLAHSLVTEALDEARRADLPPALRSELTRICNHVLHRES
ncbi:polyprenyl synthetase family protein [Sinomonas sp.]|uniref:polyprenyl synthetase family protein n=1 Tax=Sinomonas sp. TaxID=1914986 RepID=UPI003F7D12CA